MLIFMAANFVKALGLNTIIMNQLGEEGMAVFTVCDNVLLTCNKCKSSSHLHNKITYMRYDCRLKVTFQIAVFILKS